MKSMKSTTLAIALLVSLFVTIHSQEVVEFDTAYASIMDPTFLPPFYVEETYSIQKAVDKKELSETDRILIVDFSEGKVALNTRQMAWNHVAQGTINSENWMATFCVACNSGAGFIPEVNGRKLHFEAGAVFNGVIVLRDRETRSYWDHISGVSIFGELKGTRLKTFNILHSTVEQALTAYPEIKYANNDNSASKDNPFYKANDYIVDSHNPANSSVNVLDIQFAKTIPKEDTRRGTMDIGLGVWFDDKAKFYPQEEVQKNGFLFDEIKDKRIVVYKDPVTFTLRAIYTNAEDAFFNGKDLVLSNEQIIRNNFIYSNGKKTHAEMPMQIFTRWYGFSLSFPGCDIYETSH